MYLTKLLCVASTEITALISFVDIFGLVVRANSGGARPDYAFFICEIAEQHRERDKTRDGERP